MERQEIKENRHVHENSPCDAESENVQDTVIDVALYRVIFIYDHGEVRAALRTVAAVLFCKR